MWRAPKGFALMSHQPIFNAGPAICIALMTAFVVGLSWALSALHETIGFWPYMLFGAIVVPFMVACGFVWDWLTKTTD